MAEPIFEIEVSQLQSQEDGELIAGPRAGRGDTVLWIFTGDLVEKELEVRRKNNSDPSFIFHKPAKSDRVRGIPFPTDLTNDSFEYEIAVKGQVEPLRWAGGRNGGCVKPMWPRS